MENNTHTCGECVAMRGSDGYCMRQGKYINCMDKAPARCFVSHEEAAADPCHVRVKVLPTTKTCKDCGRELPLEEFPNHPKSRDGHSPLCRECYSKKMKKVQKQVAQTRPKEQLPEGMRRCTKCGRVLPLSEFGHCGKSKDGYKHHCKECSNSYARDLYRNTHASTPKEAKSVAKPVKKEDPKAKEMTAQEMVEALRSLGYTVTCTRTVTIEESL